MPPNDAAIDLDGALALRVPILADRGAIQLTATGGWSLIEAGPNVSGQIGAWVALSPTWALHLDAGFADRREAFITFGVSRLFEVR